jgi:demethylmenaquinone methyltransferase / 2-methoxy-6-polyprenyl-1,4-benzoquinol methylase
MTEQRKAPPEQVVRSMFDALVGRYDALNAVLSLGLDRRWRRRVVMAAALTPGDRVLDLGCGTGDLALLAGPAGVGGGRPVPRVVGVDLSFPMLTRARTKATASTAAVEWVQGSALRLPFADRTFDAIVSAFLLRNLEHLPQAFAEMIRVCSPGARICMLDITEPPNRVLRSLFDAYFGTMAPVLGGLVGRRQAYRYLADSLPQLPPPIEVRRLMTEAGMDGAAAIALTGGTVTLFKARIPP